MTCWLNVQLVNTSNRWCKTRISCQVEWRWRGVGAHFLCRTRFHCQAEWRQRRVGAWFSGMVSLTLSPGLFICYWCKATRLSALAQWWLRWVGAQCSGVGAPMLYCRLLHWHSWYILIFPGSVVTVIIG